MASIEIIKGMLAPGIMISACGLLLLGMNNKYSLVVSRIRNLNQEFRNLDKNHVERKKNISIQIPLLTRRMQLIKNTVWLYTTAVALFILSTLSIGINFITGASHFANILCMIFFIMAIISVLIGVIYAANEVRLGYKIVNIETEDIKDSYYVNN